MVTTGRAVSWSSGYDFPLTNANSHMFRKGSGFDSQGNYFLTFLYILAALFLALKQFQSIDVTDLYGVIEPRHPRNNVAPNLEYRY
ncbi:hypothetical protein ACN38_g7009 [Penicillium nordicum]|uniref:Uncharacterized protein n=1 Tax=Penicillium nordicum TaxID=229535 RepID=A0A0M9WEQ7_9EURO|nr:hypothetical protein ACN38_g7009 [Penicillium nordicum]